MNDWLKLLAEHASLLVCGTTLLLALGCGAVLLCKSPVHRQRIAELTIAGVLGWMVLALFPLPRLLPDNFWGAKPPEVLPLQPRLPIALDVAWPRETDSGTLLPIAEIPTTESVGLPEVFELMQEGGSDDNLADGLGNPSYGASPSEELPRLAAEVYLPKTMEAEPEEKAVSSFPAWRFDLTKLAGLFTGAYLAGGSLCLLWILAGYMLLLRIRQTAATPPEWLAKQYQALAKQSGITPPRLIISHLCSRPLTWGVLWPVIVLPRSLCRQENKSQLETILLHELGHIAQQDSHGNLLFCAALPLLYAHPLFWWLRRESQLAAELVADDWAAWQTGKETYVEELVALARCTGRSAIPLVGVTGLFSSPSLFYRRMQMLLAREKPLSTKTSLPWRLASLSALAGAVVLAASLAGVRPAVGQTDPPTTTPPATAPVPPSFAPPSTTPPTLPDAIPAPPTAPKLDAPPAGTPLLLPLIVPSVVPPPVRLPTAAIPGEQSTPPSKEEADLLAEIRQLQDKLQALEAKRGTGKHTSAQPPGVKTVTLVREDNNGVQVTEIWSTDPTGKPDRLISQSASKTKQPRTATTAVNSDGKTITADILESDGSRRTVTIDAATGKVIAENRYGATEPRTTPPTNYPYRAPSADPNTPASKPSVGRVSELPYRAPPGYGLPYPVQPGADPNMARGGQQLDLVTLATSYADAVGVLEAAEAKLKEVNALSERQAISQQGVTAAKLAFSAAQRKEQLLRSIAEVATSSAEQEYKLAFERYDKGTGDVSAVHLTEGHLNILKQILRTRTAASESKK